LLRAYLKKIGVWQPMRRVAVRVGLAPPLAHSRRSRLADFYCTGKGLEIGASASNEFHLDALNVDYSDDMDSHHKQFELEQCGQAAVVDVVASAECIPFPDSSQDFVFSSHVLEHLVDPIRALLEWDRLVRPGGAIFMIVPHKERTFDVDRERTTCDHLVQDYLTHRTTPHEGPFCHEHVWITEDIAELVIWIEQNAGVHWRLVEVHDADDKIGNGFTVVVRKTSLRDPRQGAS